MVPPRRETQADRDARHGKMFFNGLWCLLGIGLLLVPFRLFYEDHFGDDGPEWTQTCEWTADNVPEQDLSVIGCPPDPRK